MLINFIGKLLFSRLPAWQQRQRAITTVVVLLTAVVFATIVGAVIFFQNSRR